MTASLAAPAAGLGRLRAQLRTWYDRTLADPGFRAWASRFPLTRPIARLRSRALFDLCAGFVYSQILSACVSLDLFGLLARSGPLGAAAIAAQAGLSEARARTLCDGAAALGLLRRRDGQYGLGELGAALVGNDGALAMIRHHAMLYRDLADPVGLLRAGQPESELSAYWRYGGAADAGAAYSQLMAASQPLVAAEILAAYPLGRHRRLLDLGGGDGAFAIEAARRAQGLAVTVFDLPEVAARARGRMALAGLGARAAAMGGDLRRDRLPSGADCVTLVRVIHDHDDEAALAILRNARQALAPGGTLLLAEPMLDSRGAGRMGAYFLFYLLAMGSGRPRRRAELAAMLRESGFRTVRSRRVGNALLTSLLVARP